MTIQATAWAWEQHGLRPAEKLVLLTLSDESSEFAPPPDPEAVAARCELSTKELREVLASLQSAGLIDAEYRAGEH